MAFLGEGGDFRRRFLLDRLDAEHAVDVFPVGQLGCRGLGGEVIGCEFAVGVAHPVEHRAPGGGDVEVVVHRLREARDERRVGGWLGRLAKREFAQLGGAFVDAAQRGFCAGQVVEREVERLAVVGGDHEVTHLAPGAALGQKIAQRKKIAERLAHFFALNEQVRAVHPVLDELVSVALQAGAFALGDLVLVMGEHQVLAAEVEVEIWPEQLHAHCAALDVPAGPALAPRAVPKHLAVLRHAGLPEGEVGDRFLFVLVAADAFAGAHFVEIDVEQLAVFVSGLAVFLDAEIDGAVVGLVSEAGRLEFFDELDDRADERGGVRPVVRHLAAKRLEVGEEGLLEFAGELGQRLAGLVDAPDDFVLHVGDVHDVPHVEAAEGEVAPNDVGKDERAEVPDVREVVHGRAAAVDADLFPGGIERHERLDRTRQGVEDFQAHKAATD